MILIVCPVCNEPKKKPKGAVNRARSKGAPIYCGRKCAGIARRMHKTKAELVEEKRLYDQAYREKNLALLKKKKADYFQRTYDPEKAAIERQKTMSRHVEYCRRPEYRAKKKIYDEEHRAKKQYGEFWESFLIAGQISEHVDKYQVRLDQGTLNKQQKRRRML